MTQRCNALSAQTEPLYSILHWHIFCISVAIRAVGVHGPIELLRCCSRRTTLCERSSGTMHIWLSNGRGLTAWDRRLFTLLCDNLRPQRGLSVARRFPAVCALAELPRLDQPHTLEPTPLIMEIFAAWDELWTTELRHLAVPLPAVVDPPWQLTRKYGDELLGRYLATPLHLLTAFLASTSAGSSVRAATHQRLLADHGPLHAWRVIQGGRRAHESAPSMCAESCTGSALPEDDADCWTRQWSNSTTRPPPSAGSATGRCSESD
jgi:hypothetical protein